jgi:hypothetical protein
MIIINMAISENGRRPRRFSSIAVIVEVGDSPSNGWARSLQSNELREHLQLAKAESAALPPGTNDRVQILR